MKNISGYKFKVAMIILIVSINATLSAQTDKNITKYFKKLPDVSVDKSTKKYRMTAVYTNRDLYGNFTGKILVSGEYTRRYKGDTCKWNNVFISSSNSFSGDFPEGNRQN
ncbi:MAG: hypothetical protein HZB98_13500, partial [Bacteroidia bacterium]|nr:hypothetical protein [Bacteroidia bacterium]